MNHLHRLSFCFDRAPTVYTLFCAHPSFFVVIAQAWQTDSLKLVKIDDGSCSEMKINH